MDTQIGKECQFGNCAELPQMGEIVNVTESSVNKIENCECGCDEIGDGCNDDD